MKKKTKTGTKFISEAKITLVSASVESELVYSEMWLSKERSPLRIIRVCTEQVLLRDATWGYCKAPYSPCGSSVFCLPVCYTREVHFIGTSKLVIVITDHFGDVRSAICPLCIGVYIRIRTRSKFEPPQTASGSNQPFCHNTLCGQTDRSTDRQMVQANVP